MGVLGKREYTRFCRRCNNIFKTRQKYAQFCKECTKPKRNAMRGGHRLDPMKLIDSCGFLNWLKHRKFP